MTRGGAGVSMVLAKVKLSNFLTTGSKREGLARKTVKTTTNNKTTFFNMILPF
jgi:hypothetical protein